MQQTKANGASQVCVLVSGLDSTTAERVLERLRAAGITPLVREQKRERLLDPAVGGNLPTEVSRIEIAVQAPDQARAAAAIEDLFPPEGDASSTEIEAGLKEEDPPGDP